MPCNVGNHVLRCEGVSVVRRTFNATLQSGGCKFSCPSCRAPMQWMVVRHILSSVMSASELNGSLASVNKNFKLQELKGCGTKTIASVTGCPNTRACPRCGALIYHIDQCKHMPCTTCGSSFCFVCLGLQNSDKTWPCGSSSDQCYVAPRQTFIPN